MISNSQTQYWDDNTESHEQVFEDPHLKRLTYLKLMYESEIESCIDFITSGIDCGKDWNSRGNSPWNQGTLGEVRLYNSRTFGQSTIIGRRNSMLSFEQTQIQDTEDYFRIPKIQKGTCVRTTKQPNK